MRRLVSLGLAMVLGLMSTAANGVAGETDTAPASIALPIAIPATFQSIDESRPGTGCSSGQLLTLHVDGTYVERVMHDGWEQAAGSGPWRFGPAGRLILNGASDGSNDYYRIVDATELDPSPAMVAGHRSPCRLYRSANVTDFPGADPPVTLTSDIWTLTALHGVPLRRAENMPTLIFHADSNRVSGSTGCNPLSGTFEQRDSTLTIAVAPESRKRCGAATDAIAAEFLAAIERTDSLHVCCAWLTLQKHRSVLASFRTTR